MRIPATVASRLQFCVLSVIFLAASSLCASRTGRGSGPELADRIIITKSAHKMVLMDGERIIGTYTVALGRAAGAKQREGDHKTPEGAYTIDRKNPNSRFHLALHLSYLNPADRENASRLGVDPGGYIEIHGLEWGFGWLGVLQSRFDWTDGCVAATNSEIDQIFPLVPVGTVVEIRP